jgi:hypothetical protein
MGLLGVLAALSCGGLVAWRAVSKGEKTDPVAGLGLAAGLAGFAAVGAFDSLIDAPRFLFIALFLSWAAASSLRGKSRD